MTIVKLRGIVVLKSVTPALMALRVLRARHRS